MQILLHYLRNKNIPIGFSHITFPVVIGPKANAPFSKTYPLPLF